MNQRWPMGCNIYQFEMPSRVPLKNAEPDGTGGTLDFGDFTCTHVSVRSLGGASGIVYSAISEDYYGKKIGDSSHPAPVQLIIKECYPLAIADVLQRKDDTLTFTPNATEKEKQQFGLYKRRYEKAFENHAALYQSHAREQIVVPHKAYQKNGTVYLVSDVSNGDVMTEAFEHMSLAMQVKTLIRVSETISAIHDAGYVYLDLKPDNILCLRNPHAGTNDRYTGEVKLFDFDTVTPIAQLNDPETLIMGSGDWSAYEQTHDGYRNRVGLTSDIYSIGVLLFWVAMGRPPTSNEVIHSDGKWAISAGDTPHADLKVAPENTWGSLRRVLNNTLCIDPKRRYQSITPLRDDLVALEECISPAGSSVNAVLSSMGDKLEGKLDEVPTLVAKEVKGSNRRAIIGATLAVAIVIVVALCVGLFGGGGNIISPSGGKSSAVDAPADSTASVSDSMEARSVAGITMSVPIDFGNFRHYEESNYYEASDSLESASIRVSDIAEDNGRGLQTYDENYIASGFGDDAAVEVLEFQGEVKIDDTIRYNYAHCKVSAGGITYSYFIYYFVYSFHGVQAISARYIDGDNSLLEAHIDEFCDSFEFGEAFDEATNEFVEAHSIDGAVGTWKASSVVMLDATGQVEDTLSTEEYTSRTGANLEVSQLEVATDGTATIKDSAGDELTGEFILYYDGYVFVSDSEGSGDDESADGGEGESGEDDVVFVVYAGQLATQIDDSAMLLLSKQ